MGSLKKRLFKIKVQKSTMKKKKINITIRDNGMFESCLGHNFLNSTQILHTKLQIFLPLHPPRFNTERQLSQLHGWCCRVFTFLCSGLICLAAVGSGPSLCSVFQIVLHLVTDLFSLYYMCNNNDGDNGKTIKWLTIKFHSISCHYFNVSIQWLSLL